MCKLFFFLAVLGICQPSNPPRKVPALAPTLTVGTSSASSGTCTYTKDADNNVLLGPGCRVEDIFINAAAGDFHLVPGAPAIGNALCLPEVTTDFDGAPRPTPGRPPGAGCDIGAFQFPNVAAPAAPTHLRIINP